MTDLRKLQVAMNARNPTAIAEVLGYGDGTMNSTETARQRLARTKNERTNSNILALYNTETAKHTPGAELAFKSLIHTFPESSLRNYPESVKNIIDNTTATLELTEALETIIDRLSPTGDDMRARRVIAIAEAAIRKAKGEL
jgi:hypothetical protein